MEYYRVIAVELNNIAVDLFNIAQYTNALEFCSDAAGALQTFSNLYHPSPNYNMENEKKNLALKIVQMKERLYFMASGERAKGSTLECKSGAFCISKAFKIIADDCTVEKLSVTVLYNMGLIHIGLGSLNFGKQMFEFVLSFASEYKNFQDNYMNLVLATFNNLGWIHQRKNNYKDAFSYSPSYSNAFPN